MTNREFKAIMVHGYEEFYTLPVTHATLMSFIHAYAIPNTLLQINLKSDILRRLLISVTVPRYNFLASVDKKSLFLEG